MRRGLKIDEGLETKYKRITRRGWKKIEEFHHDLTHSTVFIYLNTNKAKGILVDCDIDGVVLKSTDGVADLRDQIVVQLNQRVGIEWQHVIAVQIDEGNETWHYRENAKSAQVDVALDHWMITTKPVGEHYLKAELRDNPDFHTDDQFLKDANRFSWSIKDQGKFNPPIVKQGKGYRKGNTTAYLPYTETTWSALELLLEQIRTVRESLAEFMGSPDIVERLESVGVRLLMAP